MKQYTMNHEIMKYEIGILAIGRKEFFKKFSAHKIEAT